LRYYEDDNFTGRVLPPPVLDGDHYADSPPLRPDNWSGLDPLDAALPAEAVVPGGEADGGPRREPELESVSPRTVPEQPSTDLAWLDDDFDEAAAQRRFAPDPALQRSARLAALDPDDGIAL
jgi:type IV secretion system protein VirD4